KDSYMDVRGRGSIVTDRQIIKDKWKPIVKAWFPNGPEDPNLALLKIEPQKTYYWDSETGKMVEFLKMAASIVTGKRLAEGAEGKLEL
ncbi:MAG TPA: pyridoxamine 5'-phosphate oxidase family protein, partial [Flavisolibacter sp.]